MAIFSVDTEAVASANAQTLAAAEQLRGLTAAFSARLAHLDGAWTGASAGAFQAALAEWRTAQQAVEHALDGLGRALGVASAQYAEAERITASMFR